LNVFICVALTYSLVMDETNTRKVRIAAALPLVDNAGMSEETYEALFDHATDLAYQAFDDPTDEHIVAIYMRLLINHLWGCDDMGAVTVH
jgi:hypothetical protein